MKLVAADRTGSTFALSAYASRLMQVFVGATGVSCYRPIRGQTLERFLVQLGVMGRNSAGAEVRVFASMNDGSAAEWLFEGIPNFNAFSEASGGKPVEFIRLYCNECDFSFDVAEGREPFAGVFFHHEDREQARITALDLFKRSKPACRLYYVTTGKWTADKNLEARRAAVVEDLTKLNIFGDVEFIPIDSDGIERLYRQAKNAISREFTFTRRAVAPEMPGVREAYVGLVQAKEFVGLLDDGSGSILKSVFYENVRDWQDYNAVNSEIKETLASSSDRARFALMNNGITVIAKVVRATADRFYIEDFQIVNGCQTSHVLFDQRSVLDDNVFVPMRLIATTDEDVVAAIVKSTNRQTEVKQEQLIALSDFQKKLEAYFRTSEASKRLYYERRSRQYSSTPGIEKTRIVTPTNVIRSYASMFLMEPHRTTRDFSRLVARVGTDLFGTEHRLEPYYLAASAWYRLEYLFRAEIVPRTLKPARYQLLMAARILANPDRPPRPNSREMGSYADAISATMWKSEAAEALFLRSAKIVGNVLKKSTDDDAVRTEAFTEAVKAAAQKAAG